MSEPGAAPPTAPPAASTPPASASQIRGQLAAASHGSPEYSALMGDYERALTAEAAGDGPPAVTIADNATREDIAAMLTATRDKLVTLEDKGSPEYKRLLADYEKLLERRETAPAATTPTVEVTADEDRAAAEETTRVYADMLPAGMTWDVPVVAELRAVARTAFGGDGGDKMLQGGIHSATSALREIAASGPPDPAQTEASLRSRWGSDYEKELAAASEAWDAMPKGVQQTLTKSGVRYSVPFVTYMAEVGRKLFNAPGGVERQLARFHEKETSR